MIAEENVLYLRFILLLIHGGTGLLRKITEKALKKKKTTLCSFLSSVENALMGSKDLHKKQTEILFPSSSSPDIKNFDITLLTFIILNYFTDVLDGNERNAVRQIRDIRNKYHAHTNSLNMTIATFTKEWTKLSNIIYSVAQGMPDEDKQELLGILDNVNDDQFQLKTAIVELKKIDTLNDFYGSIKEKLDEIELCQKDISTNVKDIKTEQIQQGRMISAVDKSHLGHERIIQFEMECEGVDGLLHVLDVFEEDKAANSLDELSKALSKTVKKPVEVHTSIDIDQMQIAIDSLKEHIALEDAGETDRRNESCSAANGLEGGVGSTIKQIDIKFPDESLEAELSETQEYGKGLAEAKKEFPGPKQPPLVDQPKEILSEYDDGQKMLKTYDAESKGQEDEDRLARENAYLKKQKEQLEKQIKDLMAEKHDAERKRKDNEERLEAHNRFLKERKEQVETRNKHLEHMNRELMAEVRPLNKKPDIQDSGVLQGVATGAGAGATVGSIAGPVGTVVGAVGSAAGALVGSVFGRISR